MIRPFGTQVETPQVLAALDKLGETRVQRGYRAVVEPLPYKHSKWEICFLALCFGPPGALDAEIRSRVEDQQRRDLLAQRRRSTNAAAGLLGLRRSEAALLVQWADRHAVEFRRLLEKWLGRRRGGRTNSSSVDRSWGRRLGSLTEQDCRDREPVPK